MPVMMIIRKFLLAFVTILLADAAFAQHTAFTIKGRVVDDGGKGIELATVSLNQSLVTGTAKEGVFQINNVPAGTYTYRVSFVGYADGEDRQGGAQRDAS